MNRDLMTLRQWADERSRTDEDAVARPLWAQIAQEVGDYLDDDTPHEPTGPDLFETGVTP